MLRFCYSVLILNWNKQGKRLSVFYRKREFQIIVYIRLVTAVAACKLRKELENVRTSEALPYCITLFMPHSLKF
jgi:hypothetical protein